MHREHAVGPFHFMHGARARTLQAASSSWPGSRAPLQPTPQAAWPRRVSTRSTVSRVSTRSTVSTVSDYERRRP